MMDIDVRTRLEVEFCGKLDYIIDLLIREDFPSDEVEVFKNTVKTFLKYQDIREYIVSALHDKTNQLSKVILVANQGFLESFRKFIAVLIQLDDKEVVEMLETNFAKDKNLRNFFVLIEEEIRLNKSTTNCEKLFFSLMTLRNFDLATVSEFLRALQKDKVYLVERLLENQSYAALRKFTEEVGQKEVLSLKEIVPVFIEKFSDKMNSAYLDMVRVIMTYDPSFADALLLEYKWDIRVYFERYLLKSSSGSYPLISNYCEFLKRNDEQWFLSFEKELLDAANSHDLVRYSSYVPFCSKRMILRKLIENKDEHNLVEFIKKFPEYRNLLPML